MVRHALTPLTSVALDVTRERERFVTSQFRDSDSTKVMGNVTFQPLALINGTASVGVRQFDPVPADVPAFTGVITAVNLSYSLLGITRFGVEATRDIQYSFEFEQPYYLESGVTGTVQQQVFGPFDVLGADRHARSCLHGSDRRRRRGVEPHRPREHSRNRRRLPHGHRQAAGIHHRTAAPDVDDSRAHLHGPAVRGVGDV